MMATSKQLVLIEDALVEHLIQGETTPLGTGALILSVVTLPSLPVYSPTDVGNNLATGSKDVSSHVAGDQWLVMSLRVPGDHDFILEVPISSTSRIVTLPPSSYVFPNYAVPEGDEGGFIKVTLPKDVDSNHRESFENVLWGMSSFSTTTASTEIGGGGGGALASSSLSPSAADSTSAPVLTVENPSDSDQDLRSALILVDEESGQVLGSLEHGVKIFEDPSLALEGQGPLQEKEPVIISFTEQSDGGMSTVEVKPLSAWVPIENANDSKILSLADYVCKGIVVGAEMLGNGMERGSEKFVKGTKPAVKPLVFNATTKKTLYTTHKLSQNAVKVSGKTLEVIGVAASKIGDTVGKTLGIQSTPSGKAPKGVRGFVNKSLIAFNAITDSLEVGGRTILESGSKSSSAMVGHKYGPEAQELSSKVSSSVKHVVLVYVDARGVTRKALLKTVGKSAFRAKTADGSEIILSSNGVEGESLTAAEPSLDSNEVGTTNATDLVSGTTYVALTDEQRMDKKLEEKSS